MRPRLMRYRAAKPIERMTRAEIARAVLRFSFPDGTHYDLRVTDYLATVSRQREALAGIRAKLRTEASRANGRRGGRPRTYGKPEDASIVIRFGELWLKLGARREFRGQFLKAQDAARAELVKELAGLHGVHERTVRNWVLAAIGERGSSPRRNRG